MAQHGTLSLRMSDEERRLLLGTLPARPRVLGDAELRRLLVVDGPVTLELQPTAWDALTVRLSLAADEVPDPGAQAELHALHDRIVALLESRDEDEDAWPVTGKVLHLPAPGGNGGNGDLAPRRMRAAAKVAEMVSWMNELLYCAWDDPYGVLNLRDSLALDEVQGAPLFRICRDMLTVIEEMGGAKLTPGGNFQRRFVKEILEHERSRNELFDWLLARNKAVNEQDVCELHLAKIACGLAGLSRKYRGSLRVSRRGRELLPDSRAGRLYRTLFITFFTRFSLAYLDGYPPLRLVQDAAAISLFALSWAGADWGTAEELAEPMLLPPVGAALAETVQRGREGSLVESRLLRPLSWFGLVEERRAQLEDQSYPTRQYRKTDLFDRFISFRR